ncbi:gephyrin-like molybdotransferase receptor GlpR [Streptomyces ovatisporus]|uniref:Gephyrin-like molybdotransferase receptor GlpR n=1 Tax=Streptomyces ovatisporus TaxID=1128682 RepID=A0ABV9A5F0_9ACTN
MGAAKPLYRVRVNSSGLIYAVIVGAWAAYLVPMWLRRQDELNESRPTERFSTAIRLLSGKAAMERRYAKEAEREGEVPEDQDDFGDPLSDPLDARQHAAGRVGGFPEDDGAHEGVLDDASDEAVDVRAYADPKTMVGEGSQGAPTELLAGAGDRAGEGESGNGPTGEGRSELRQSEGARQPSERGQARGSSKSTRAKVLARRRRTTMVLFLAFTAGTVVAGVGGITFLWAPGGPGLLLSAYIVHLRVQERRRFAVTMDKRRAEAAAHRLHERQPAGPAGPDPETEALAGPPVNERAPEPAAAKPGAQSAARSAPRSAQEPAAADRRALVEQTDHAEWVDQQRNSDSESGEGWDPVPVPLPTYVSAPVAPRATRGVDLEEPGTWSSARSSTVSGETGGNDGPDDPAPAPRRGRGHGRTPLFDQYEDEDRPRAANE